MKRKGIYLALVVLLLVVGFGIGHLTGSSTDTSAATTEVTPADPVQTKPEPPKLSAYGVWQGINEQRAKAGLKPLSLSPALNKVAEAKCDDMNQHHYFAHEDLQGNKSWHYVYQYYGNYWVVGENLADGSYDDHGVITAWMNSPEHKVNILDQRFVDTGVFVCSSSDRMFSNLIVQEFAKPR